MPAMDLHPEILTKNGEKMFAVLPYDEFLELQERLDDMQDALDLQEAREENKDAVGVPIDDLLRKYGLAPKE